MRRAARQLPLRASRRMSRCGWPFAGVITRVSIVPHAEELRRAAVRRGRHIGVPDRSLDARSGQPILVYNMPSQRCCRASLRPDGPVWKPTACRPRRRAVSAAATKRRERYVVASDAGLSSRGWKDYSRRQLKPAPPARRCRPVGVGVGGGERRGRCQAGSSLSSIRVAHVIATTMVVLRGLAGSAGNASASRTFRISPAMHG